LRQNGLDFELVRTERPFHAADLAYAAAGEGFDVVVAVGGDGTANEVINGLMQAREKGVSKTAVAALGAGRGNDFSFSLGMPADLDEACRVLAKSRRKRIDIGHMRGGIFPDGRYFGNSLGIGFDAVVSIEALKMTRLSGMLSYLVAVLKTVFLYYQAPQVEIRCTETTVSLPALLVSIMNGRRQGGIFMMSPASQNDDALFDICVVREVSRPRIFTLIPHFISGSQFGQKEVRLLQGARVTVTAVEGVLPAHLDGEIISREGQELQVEMVPGALQAVGNWERKEQKTENGKNEERGTGGK
jgi:YegS/Rv2252/BmrU family lipid kinase